MVIVSVIIPTYNRSHLLEKAIQSVLAQSFKDFEILIVQNGPNEHSKSIVGPMIQNGHPIRYFYETKSCPVNARNCGVHEAKGQYVAFLDDDDEWLPTKLEKQLQILESKQDIDLVSCPAWLVNEDGAVISRRPEKAVHCDYKALINTNVTYLIPSLSGVLMRRECFDKVGLFKEGYASANDFEFYLRLAKVSKIEIMEEPLYLYRVHQNNMSKNIAYGHGQTVRILKTVKPAGEYGVTKAMIKEAITRNCRLIYNEAYDAWLYGRYRDAWEKFASLLLLDPMIGAKIDWSKYPNPVYKVLRPYWLISFSFARWFCKSIFAKMAVMVRGLCNSIITLRHKQMASISNGCSGVKRRIGYHVYGLGGVGAYVTAMLENIDYSQNEVIVYFRCCDCAESATFKKLVHENGGEIREIDEDGVPLHIQSGSDYLHVENGGPCSVISSKKDVHLGLMERFIKGVKLFVYYFKAVMRSRAAFKKDRLDLLHINPGNFPFLPAAVVGALFSGIKNVLVTIHLLDIKPARLDRLVDRILMFFTVHSRIRIIALSDAMKDLLIKRFGFDQKQICVIHNGVDLQRYQPGPVSHDLLREFKLSPQERVVLIPARLSWVKGHDILFDVIAKKPEKYTNVKFICAGAGDKEPQLRELAGRLEIDHQVLFVGHRQDIQDVMRLADFIVLPSRNEAMPFALLEAMALGKPVIATDVGGVREIVQNNENGFLISSESAGSLSVALDRMLAMNDADFKRMSAAAREWVERNFSLEKMIEQTFALYNVDGSFKPVAADCSRGAVAIAS